VPFARSGFCCPPVVTTTAPSDSLSAGPSLSRFCRLWAGIASRSAAVGRWSSARPDDRAIYGQPVTLRGVRRRHMSGRQALCLPPPPAPGPRRASPVPRTTFWPFNAPYAGEFLGTRSRFLGAFRGLRPLPMDSALSWSALRRGKVTTLARASLPLQTGQLLAPSQGLCRSASTAGSRPTPGAVLPGTLASPRARLALAGCPQLVARVLPVPPPPFGSWRPSRSGRTSNTFPLTSAASGHSALRWLSPRPRRVAKHPLSARRSVGPTHRTDLETARS
jgi:hypothetical protein